MAREPQLRRLSADDILKQEDKRFLDVEVPEWGALITIQSISGAERDAIEGSMILQKVSRDQHGKTRRTREFSLANLRAKLVAQAAVDSDHPHPAPAAWCAKPHPRLFTDEQVIALGKKNASALTTLFEVAQSLSGLSDEQVEEIIADLGNDPSAATGSG